MANVFFASEKDMQEVFIQWLKNTEGEDTQIEQYFKIGDYGIADVITANTVDPGDWNINIYELKNRKFEIKDLIQVLKYAKGISDIFDIPSERIFLNIVTTDYDTNDDSIYLPDVFCCKLFLYKSQIDINGVKFNFVSGYSLKNQTKTPKHQFFEKIKKIAEEERKSYIDAVSPIKNDEATNGVY